MSDTRASPVDPPTVVVVVTCGVGGEGAGVVVCPEAGLPVAVVVVEVLGGAFAPRNICCNRLARSLALAF